MKYFNYLEAPYNREKKVGLIYDAMLCLQTICVCVDRMYKESFDYENDNIEEILSGQVEEYDPQKSVFMKQIIEDIHRLFNCHENNVEALKFYNKKAYKLLWHIYLNICNADIDNKPNFEDLKQFRKELAKTEF